MDRKRLAKFVGDDWADQLLPFFKGREWDIIQKEIKRQKSAGYSIYPTEQDLFRCFKECPWSEMHSIIMNNECYHLHVPDRKGVAIADGLAFSARYSHNCPVELNCLLTEIDFIHGDETGVSADTDNYDLTGWAKQGILLLNCSMTAVEGKSYVHAELWRPFIVYLCEQINYIRNRIGIILVGKYSKQFKSLFDNDSFGIFECENPLEAAGGRYWQSNDVISDLTKFQYEKNNIKINWKC